ncbi:MAG: PilZ domain-containing protein [Pseudomonadota bacterium]
MTREPIINKEEIAARLSRMVSSSLLTGKETGKATVTSIKAADYIEIRTTVPLQQGAGVWLEFVDGNKSRYGFTAQAIRASDDWARLSYPKVIFRINYRESCRVDVHPQSKVRFTCEGNSIAAELIDISATGAALRAKSFTNALDTPLKDMELVLVSADGSEERLMIPSATIKRILPRADGNVFYGVAFEEPAKNVIERLMYYVSQRLRTFIHDRRGVFKTTDHHA